jgi:hypothetical protein
MDSTLKTISVSDTDHIHVKKRVDNLIKPFDNLEITDEKGLSNISN